MNIRRATGIAVIILMVVVFCGCDIASVKDFIEQRVAWYNRETALYITSTYTGRIYRYDFDTHEAELWFSTGENGTGAIYFHNDAGYVAVGAASSSPGLYRFDPRLKTPTISRIGTAVSAQYVAFYSDAKAYVTDHVYGASTGVYTFDPSNPGTGLSGPISGTEYDGSRMLQHIILGVDNRIYVSSYGDDTVLQINPVTDIVMDTWASSAANPQGLLSEFSGITSYIYVLCPAGAGTGVIDRYTPAGAGSRYTVLSGIDVHKMVHHEGTDRYYAIGYSKTYVLSPTTPAWTYAEITDGGSSFSGNDIVVHGDLVFIADYDIGSKVSRLYVIDTATEALTDYSPVSIMEDGVDGASNLAVY